MSEQFSKTVEDGTSITVQFSNGTERTVDLADLSDDLRTKSALFGLKRKLVNSFAGCGGDVAEAIKSLDGVIEQLMGGLWVAPRESTGGAKARSGGDLIAAVAAITGKTLDEVAEKLEGMTKEAKSALRKNPQVEAKILEMKAARAQARVSEAPSLEDMFG